MRQFALTAPFVALAALFGLAGPASAQAPAAQAPAVQASAAQGAADPVVARVDGTEVHLSDVQDAVQGLPTQYRSMPLQMLYPAVIDQLVDHMAVAAMARKQGLDKDQAVQHQMARAQEEVLQSALFHREIAPLITDEAVRSRYDHDVAGKPGEAEVHARHILVANEADAVAIVAELQKGGDFAAIAKARSTDPGAAQGGDLGWFKKDDMLPEFAAAAFALQPGQISDKPAHTRYGWHVIKVEERRTSSPPSFEQAHDELRDQMVQENVQKLVASARSAVKIEKYNPDGSAPRPTDSAEPPPVPQK